MRLLIANHFANAYESLRSNRMRTTLTILGVTIGIASITVILSLSSGASRLVTSQVGQLGGSTAIVRPGSPMRDLQLSDITASLGGTATVSSLTEQDLITIKNIPEVEAAAPLMLLSGSLTASDETPDKSSLVATTPDFINITPLDMIDGQFIDSVTNQETAVIGAQLSVDLFGTEQSIGRTFRTHGTTFTVIGIIKRQNNPINYNNIDLDHTAIISLEIGKNFNQGVASLQQINIKSTSPDKLAGVVEQTKNTIQSNHFGETNFSIMTDDDLVRPSNELFAAISATLSTVAAISLIVGGIGIMNIMLVGVTERTREIGIRKALGASNTHITWQFLIESLVMSSAGGVLGYLAGYLAAFAISRSFLTFDPAFTWTIAGVALGVSVLVGTLFGLYPAIRAARKDPIEALRQYH